MLHDIAGKRSTQMAPTSVKYKPHTGAKLQVPSFTEGTELPGGHHGGQRMSVAFGNHVRIDQIHIPKEM